MRAHHNLRLLLAPLIFMAARAAGSGDGSFRFPLKIDTGAPAVGAAAGDFNRDGKLDLAVVHGGKDITVLLQDGASSDRWTPAPPLEAGQAGFHLRAADFDGDGDADLALADPATGVHFLRSLGDGTFENPLRLEGCASARWLAVGDWDGDQRPDLAAACYRDLKAAFYLTGPEGLPIYQGEIRMAGAPHSIEALHLDGDGRLDLLVGASFPGLMPLWGRAGGAFESGPIARDLGICYRTVVAGDFNGDGLGDSVTSCLVALNRGNGSFRSGLNLAGTAGDFAGLTVGDYDGDRAHDVAVVDDLNDLNLTVYAGKGNGEFRPPVLFGPIGSIHPASFSFLLSADLDGDGQDDLVCPDGGARALTIFQGNRERLLDAVAVRSGFGPARAFEAADVDRDGTPDLVIAHLTLPRLDAYRGFDTSAPPLALDSGFNFSTLKSADLDGDGLDDLTGTSLVAGTALVALLDRAGGVRGSASLRAGSYPASVQAGFIDADASIDLLVPCAGSSDLALFLGTGGGAFAPARSFPTMPQPRAAALGDVDGDGLLDAAAVTIGEVGVHFGTGPGELSALASVDRGEGRNYSSVAIADLDRDGAPELLAAEVLSKSLRIFRASPGRRFEAAGALAVGVEPASLALADLNGDDLPDVSISSSTSSQSLAVLLNRGAQGFSEPQVYRVGLSFLGHSVIDLDRDGALDLAAVSRGQAFILHGRPVVASRFRRGDADGDGRMELNDAVAIIGRLFLGGDLLRCEDSADANDDGVLNLSDPIAVLGRLFLGAEPLPPPGPEACGEDPTPDTLSACAMGC